ncbi:Panacea domain-containing protein [Dyadobacter crusticola]|uniref:Panacea domain-containing protein n=1 Tax=Dyadobacter crusticola TaxID=292407 RepID=UPI0004E23AAD|nr:Panacea domain-containing protein [Dyadobacter crusticola]
MKIDERRLELINILLYVISKLGTADYHKIFKILYFAEQEHIRRFGRTLLNDDYVAMKYGPVPSNAYDILKSVPSGDWSSYFTLVGEHSFKAVSEPNLNYLSESEMLCIDNSIDSFGSLTFSERTDKSHDDAYNAVKLNHKMDILEIGRVGGASEDTLNYLQENLETKQMFK